MAIDITALFTKLGRAAKVALVLNQHQAALDPALTDLSDEYQGTTDRDLVANLDSSQDSIVRGSSSLMASVASLAKTTLVRAVKADAPASARTTRDAVAEVRRQMVIQGKTVPACTVAVTSTALSGSVGSGVVVLSPKRGDGLVQENAVAEVGRLVCQGDSYAGTATVDREPFLYVGKANAAGTWDYDWPQGSGASTAMNAVDPTDSLMLNGDFEDWTSSAADSWTATAGVWGTDMVQSSTALGGSYSVRLPAGATPANIYQAFADPVAQTSYAVNLWLRTVSGVATGGVLTVDLVDGSGVAITDQQGGGNSFAVALSTLSTSWSAANGVFRLPASLPSSVRLRVRVTTALTGADVLVDDLAMGTLTALYPGGPGAAVFAGGTPFVTGDGWDVTTTNDRAGQSYLSTWQGFFARLFEMLGWNQLLPSSGAPNLPDSLITS